MFSHFHEILLCAKKKLFSDNNLNLCTLFICVDEKIKNGIELSLRSHKILIRFNE